MKLNVLTICILCFGLALSASAEDYECYKDQYLLERSASPLLNQKAVENLASASFDTVRLAEASDSALLIETKPALAAMTSSQGENTPNTIIPEDAAPLCDRVRKADRLERLKRIRAGRLSLVRRTACICNYKISVSAQPNDSYYGLQWGFDQSNDIDMNIAEAWGIATGQNQPQKLIAVIDSGVDYTHPDLQANMWTNPGEVPNNGIDDDGNGVIDDVHGYNAINNSGDPMDQNGHGTHVAGTIGATANNNKGVAGVLWNTKIVAVKFLDANGSGSLYDALKAIDYVNNLDDETGTEVVLSNNSWGGGGYFQGMVDAINRAKTRDILFVAASGNSGVNTESQPMYPAAYSNDNIVSVAAIDKDGGLASFSNYGKTRVDIAAPGVDIASTHLNDGYVYLSGTSMASPHVAGALGLLANAAPDLTASELKANLLTNGKILSSITEFTLTGMIPDLHKMLLNANVTPNPGGPGNPTPTPTPTPPPATPTPTPEPTPIPTPGVFSLDGKVVNEDNLGIAQVQITFISQKDGSTISRHTGPNGLFSFPAIDGPVHFTLQAKRNGYIFSPISDYLRDNKTLTLNGSLATFRLTAKVVTDENQAVANVQIYGGPVLGYKNTDYQGQVHFDVPMNLEYTLLAQANSYTFQESERSGTIFGNVTRVFVAKD